MAWIDLQSDLGESFGSYKLGMDEEVLPYVTSANIACGYHAGDPLVMDETVKMCRENHTAVGAHPGYPDLMGFGRRNMKVTPAEAKAYIQYQVGALQAFCRSNGVELQHVKCHGALYNMAAKDYSLSLAIAEAIREIDPGLIMVCLSGSEMVKAGRDAGVRVASEIFADRAYQADGSLVPRGTPGAMITDTEVSLARVVRMIREHRVTAITGEEIEVDPQTICVHGDSPKAIAFVRAIRNGLEKEGIQICSMSEGLR